MGIIFHVVIFLCFYGIIVWEVRHDQKKEKIAQETQSFNPIELYEII